MPRPAAALAKPANGCRSIRATLRRLAVLLLGCAVLAAAQAAAPLARRPMPVVSREVRRDLSPPLRSLKTSPRPGTSGEREAGTVRPLPGRKGRPGKGPGTAAVQSGSINPLSLLPMPPPVVSFDGVNNRDANVPPDPVLDIGPHHIVQWVNVSFAIWDKRGTLLYGPVEGNTLWSGFGGLCETRNDGDPIVQYDQLADRWIMSQLAFNWPADFHQCLAISQTGDPLGPWYRYDFPFSQNVLNDYPKLGVWPDAYYLAVNQYEEPGDLYRGQGAIAFEREKMLTGAPARMVYFDLYGVNPNFGGALPSDMDGPLPPPAGSPNYFVEVDDDNFGWTPIDRLSLWRFHVDWNNPANSSFGTNGEPDAVIDLTTIGYPFDSDLCGYSATCISQPGGSHVDALSDRLMYRLAYRNLGDHETLVLNHTVDVDGADHAGIRWYELRDPGSTSPVVYQAGTFAPDSDHRWMASAAMDGAGDLCIGYSVSSATTYPSIRYAGRQPLDPSGTLPMPESSLVAGSGYQGGARRWGDYSSLVVDPSDDCTFWYTQEYYASVSSIGWQTRIGAFKLNGCATCPLVGPPSLSVDRGTGGLDLSWSATANAGVYDVVEGALSTLRDTGGDFMSATARCLSHNLPATSLQVEEADPAPGQGFWYIVRGVSNGCLGTFDEPGSSQSGSRDDEINSSLSGCS
jgi:hypothetical protein